MSHPAPNPATEPQANPGTPQGGTGVWLMELLIILLLAIAATAAALLLYGS